MSRQSLLSPAFLSIIRCICSLSLSSCNWRRCAIFSIELDAKKKSYIIYNQYELDVPFYNSGYSINPDKFYTETFISVLNGTLLFGNHLFDLSNWKSLPELCGTKYYSYAICAPESRKFHLYCHDCQDKGYFRRCVRQVFSWYSQMKLPAKGIKIIY